MYTYRCSVYVKAIEATSTANRFIHLRWPQWFRIRVFNISIRAAQMSIFRVPTWRRNLTFQIRIVFALVIRSRIIMIFAPVRRWNGWCPSLATIVFTIRIVRVMVISPTWRRGMFCSVMVIIWGVRRRLVSSPSLSLKHRYWTSPCVGTDTSSKRFARWLTALPVARNPKHKSLLAG